MKPTDARAVHHTGDETEDVTMQLDQSSLAHIMAVLTDLYSDPVAAVLREYSTNALDSHIEAGQTDPVEVQLPRADSCQLVVRDRGVGLSVDDLRDVYSMYGRSTKRGSDAVAGMLGLGCKSGLTYAVSFTVTAVQGGTRAVAMVTRNEDGIGVIKVLDVEETGEPNGVTVTVPAKQADVARFKKAARDLFRHWPEGSVLVDGQPPEPLGDGAVWVDPDLAVLPGKPENTQSYVVMGSVPYPFTHKFPHRLVAYVPMGTVDFVPSREQLHMTALTRETLEDVEEYARRRLEVKLLEHAAELETPFERAHLIAAWQKGKLSKWVKTRLKWLAGELDLRLPAGTPAFRFHEGKTRTVSGKVQWDHVADEEYAVVTDFPLRSVTRVHRERLAEFLGDDKWVVLPAGADTAVLEGRPAVYGWEEVLSKTERPRSAPSRRQATVYPFYRHGVHGSPPRDGEVVTYCASKGAEYSSRRFPETVVADLKAGQVARFCRLYPQAVDSQDYNRAQVRAALAALTEDDLLAHTAANSGVMKALKKVADRVDDPDLRRCLGLMGRQSAALKRAAALNVQVPAAPLVAEVTRRYPLVAEATRFGSSCPAEDALLYVNAKHAGRLAAARQEREEGAA